MSIRVSDRSRAKHRIAKMVVEFGDKYCAFRADKKNWKVLNTLIGYAVYVLWPR